MSRNRSPILPAAPFAVLLAIAALGGTRSLAPTPEPTPRDVPAGDRTVTAAAAGPAVRATPRAHEVVVHQPPGPPTVELVDATGAPQSISCTVCHSLRDPDFANRTVADLDQFHRELQFEHGALSCLSCHNSDDYGTLRLADRTVVDYRDVMTLCAQCHGTQHRDYVHGAHGGMSGYWNLSWGPRMRDGCTDCHDPHAPRFPSMTPTFKPRDRFLTPPNGRASHE